MFSFHKKYFIAFLLLLLTELFIGFFVHDRFIRPYAGDYLVVIMVYCFIKSFINALVWKACLGTLLFAYAVEFLQYCDIVGILGLTKSKIANVLIGNSFSWVDIVAYTLGVVTVFSAERFLESNDFHAKTAKELRR